MSTRDNAHTLTQLHAEMRTCTRCLDAGYPVTPGAIISGPVTAQIMIVGQAPGISEPEAGRPFNGTAGRRLFTWLAQAGWSEPHFRATQYITAICKCFPGKHKSGRGDRVPTRAEQTRCESFLKREIALVRPHIILPVGGLAIRRFLGSVKLIDVVGQVHRAKPGTLCSNATRILPLPHPSGASLWLNKLENQARVQCALECLCRLQKELDIQAT